MQRSRKQQWLRRVLIAVLSVPVFWTALTVRVEISGPDTTWKVGDAPLWNSRNHHKSMERGS